MAKVITKYTSPPLKRLYKNVAVYCHAGKIDLILIKPISRRGRNTVDLLDACGELRDLGIEGFFAPRSITLFVEWRRYLLDCIC